MAIALEKRGQVEVDINGRKVVLHATFENMAYFEQSSGVGLYVIVTRLGQGDVRVTDLVNTLWCFSTIRGTEGWTQDELTLTVASNPAAALEIVEGFLAVIFGLNNSTEATDTDPKKRQRARSK